MGRVGPRRASRRQPAWLHGAAGMLDGIGGLGWSVIGFVVGAVFWHFIGFWGFVSEVVLAGRPPEPAAQSRMHTPAVAEKRPVQVADAAPCTVLALDRQTGVTSARACVESGSALRADAFQGREDRIVVTPRMIGRAAIASD